MTHTPRILSTSWRRQGRTFGPVLRDMFGSEVQYVHSVQEAGGDVYLVPQPAGYRDASELVSGFDGLVLIGGEDLAAEVSGADPATIGENPSADRDRWEIALLQAALAMDVPVLAICRGLQVLNVAFGGTLHGDISGCSAEHPSVPDVLSDALAYRHRITVEPGSLLHAGLGSTVLDVNSLHHQAVDRVGDGIAVTARAADGHVESVEVPAAGWCLGVQWHPELLPDDAPQRQLFARFVAECRRPVSTRP
jgi:putative glutamine amidotransferase